MLLVPFGLAGLFRRRRRVAVVAAAAGLCVVVVVSVTCEGDCGYQAESSYYFYHTDHRGAPVFMTDENAVPVWTAVYRPYGEAYIDPDPDGDGVAVTNNLRYPGQYEDNFEDFPEGERLYYNVMRYYDPGLGRHLTPERVIYVIELAKRVYDRNDRGIIDLNAYRYSYSNPIFYHDKYGLQGIPGTEMPDCTFCADYIRASMIEPRCCFMQQRGKFS